jgi:hypothetical protein
MGSGGLAVRILVLGGRRLALAPGPESASRLQLWASSSSKVAAAQASTQVHVQQLSGLHVSWHPQVFDCSGLAVQTAVCLPVQLTMMFACTRALPNEPCICFFGKVVLQWLD